MCLQVDIEPNFIATSSSIVLGLLRSPPPHSDVVCHNNPTQDQPQFALGRLEGSGCLFEQSNYGLLIPPYTVSRLSVAQKHMNLQSSVVSPLVIFWSIHFYEFQFYNLFSSNMSDGDVYSNAIQCPATPSRSKYRRYQQDNTP